MFTIFKQNPVKKLNKLYEAKLDQAIFAQRNGDIKAFAILTAEAEKISLEIQTLEAESKTS